MQWKEYQKLIDRKISDAKYNYETAKDRFNRAKIEYENALMEKENFEKALENKLIQIERQVGE